tara:strand:- start:728 stop:1684 length:957 start_codon:yes stop_codon:yes gene_type:complete
MIKVPPNLQELENFDVIPYNQFIYRELINLHQYKKVFDISTHSVLDDRRTKKVDRVTFPIFKNFDENNSYYTTRINYKLKDKDSGMTMMFNTQGAVRLVEGNEMMMYLKFPIKDLSKYVKRPKFAGEGTRYIYDKFINTMDTIGWTGDNFTKIKKKFHLKYDKEVIKSKAIKNQFNQKPLKRWHFDYNPEYRFFYKKYGMLTLPVLDRCPQYFVGSSHSVFHLNELKIPYVPILLTIPKKGKNYITNWYGYIPKENFESKKFYLFFIDILTKSFYGKVYDYENNKELYSNMVSKPLGVEKGSLFKDKKRYFDEFKKIY